MLRFVVALAFVIFSFVAAALVNAQNPPDMACINWKAWTSSEPKPNMDELFIVTDNAWVMQYSCDYCSQRGYIIPCWTTDAGHTRTFGHTDYNSYYIPNDFCRIYTNETGQPGVYKANNYLLPFRGPQYKTHQFILTQTGAAVPDDVIRVGDRAMAISTTSGPNCCSGVGFSGWAEIVLDASGKEVFGNVHFSIVDAPFTTQSFEVAICKAYTNPPQTTTAAPPSPTSAPPTPAPTTAAPNTKPYIKFAHAIPANVTVTATIAQGSVSYTWKCKSFGYFSGWEQQFSVGNGEVSIQDCSTGKLLLNQTMYLSPGPLVITLKGYEINQFSLEGIAASYVPTAKGTSGVRLFNLMPDVVSAGLDASGKKLVDGVKFTLGSIWATVNADATMNFTAFDDQTSKTLASNSFQAPESPFVFTQFLIGLANASSSSAYAPTMIPLIDAPES